MSRTLESTSTSGGSKKWDPSYGSGGSMKFEIKPFDEKINFGLWQRRMRGVLVQQRLVIALLGIEKRPVDMTEAEWSDIDQRAISSIEMYITDDVLNHVISETTAKGMWDQLEEIYLGKSLSNKLFLKKMLFKLEMKEGGDMMKHINVFNALINDLNRIDVQFSEEDRALLLLASLPDSYEHFVTTLMFGKTTLKFNDVMQDIISHVAMKKKNGSGGGSSSSQSEGLVAKVGGGGRRGRSKSRGANNRGFQRSQSRDISTVECFKCHKKGHFKRNCPEWKKDDKKGDATKDVAGVATLEEGEEVLTCFSADHVDGWILDSGCSYHMCPNREWFEDYKSNTGGEILMGNNATCKVVGIGSVHIKMWDGVVRTLSEVRHVPALKKNLISLGALDSKGCVIQAEGGALKVKRGSMVILRGTKLPNNLYRLKGNTVVGGAAVSTEPEIDELQLWHMRLGHMSQRGMEELHRRKLLKGVHGCKLGFCKYCVMGKQTRVQFTISTNKSKGTLDYIHSDVCGPSDVVSIGGFRYFVTFIDDYSRKVWVYYLKEKSEVFEKFKEWKAMVENQTGKKIKYLRSDNGGEYRDGGFLKYCKDAGITRHFTVKKTPQQNGVAERMNRTIMERARCMRFHAGLPKSFWAAALDHAVYLVNRSPNSTLGLKCPEEVWSGHEVDYSTLRVFGCPGYAHIPSDERTKNDPKTRRCIFLGYGKGVKGFKLWDPSTRKLVVSRDVRFDETSMLKAKEFLEVTDDGGVRTVEIPLVFPRSSTTDSDSASTSGSSDSQSGDDTVEVEPNEDDLEEELVEVEDTQRVEQVPSIARDRERREIKPPSRLGWEEVNYALISSEGDPTTYKDAINCDVKASWMGAMSEEMEALRKNSVWELVPKPKGRHIVGSKWVYRKKEAINKIEEPKYKARLVAKGFSQKEGIDYDEIFSPVVRHTSIRVLLAMVAQFDMELEQMDVKTAFLHGDLKELIYMVQPEGFKEVGKEDHVCRLKKSLYGLKQSPRQWYLRFDTFMLRVGYTRCDHDHCAYFRVLDDGLFVLLMLYVDDMLIACRDMSRITELKVELSREFDMKDLGAAQKILGMEIRRDRKVGKLWLSQKNYISHVIEKFGMLDAKATSTPLASHFALSAKQCPSTDDELEEMASTPYACAVGCLMYAMVCTRPDIAQAVGVVSKYMSNPGKEHWKAVKWILRYLKGTKSMGIVFERKKGAEFVAGYVDSDYAADLDKRRSTSGYVFTIASGPVSWRSMLQATSALSTTEAEYMALTEASKEAVWLKSLVSQLGMKQESVRLYCDSQSAMHLAKNQVYHARTKHIDVRYHRVRDWVNSGEVLIEKVHTDENAADFLTKPVTTEKFRHCLKLLNLTSC